MLTLLKSTGRIPYALYIPYKNVNTTFNDIAIGKEALLHLHSVYAILLSRFYRALRCISHAPIKTNTINFKGQINLKTTELTKVFSINQIKIII